PSCCIFSAKSASCCFSAAISSGFAPATAAAIASSEAFTSFPTALLTALAASWVSAGTLHVAAALIQGRAFFKNPSIDTSSGLITINGSASCIGPYEPTMKILVIFGIDRSNVAIKLLAEAAQNDQQQLRISCIQCSQRDTSEDPVLFECLMKCQHIQRSLAEHDRLARANVYRAVEKLRRNVVIANLIASDRGPILIPVDLFCFDQ